MMHKKYTPYRRFVVKPTFLATIFVQIFCQFFTSFLSMSNQKDDEITDFSRWYTWLFMAIAIIPSIIETRIAYKYQGEEIAPSNPHEQDEDQVPPAPAPRSYESTRAEISFLVVQYVSLFMQNYFTASSYKAWILTLTGDTHHGIASLDTAGWLTVLLVATFVDTPFEWSNGVCNTLEDIKQTYTGSKDNALIHEILQPFTSRYGKIWLLLGLTSHVLDHLISLQLLFPPRLILYFMKSTLSLVLFTIVAVASLLYGLATGFIQTGLFDYLSSLANLNRIQQATEKTGYITIAAPSEEKEQQNAESTIELPQWAINLIRWNIWPQILQHAANTTAPVVVLLRHMLAKQSLGVEVAITVPLALTQFLLFSQGYKLSEYDASIKHLKEFGPKKRLELTH